MSDPEVLAQATRWLRYAAEDVRFADAAPEQDDAQPRHIAYDAQQGAEKAIKAALVFEQIDFPFSHDLDALRNLLPDGWSVRRDLSDLRALSEWAVEARYPGDWPGATHEEAAAGVRQGRAVHASIAHDFGVHGVAASVIENELAKEDGLADDAGHETDGG